MATYDEIRALTADPGLQNKVEVAILVSAATLAAGTPTDAQRKWIVDALRHPRAQAEIAIRYLLAVNRAGSVATLQNASDATVQAGVDGIVPVLVAAASL